MLAGPKPERCLGVGLGLKGVAGRNVGRGTMNIV